MKLASFGAIVLLAACAHRAPTTAGCDRFTGSYVLDPASCHDSHGLLQVHLDTARLPDEAVIDPTPMLDGIHQDGCDTVSLVFRENRGSREHRGLVVDVAAGEARWENGALMHLRREWSNLPPPIAIDAHGDWTWSLRRKPNSDDLLYTSAYAERGLFFLIPYNAHRETTCTLTRQR